MGTGSAARFDSANFELVNFLQSFIVTDVLLPFLLIFTIIFAVLQRIELFGDKKRNINTVLALIFAALGVVPHVTGRYPQQYDPVIIINALIPSAAVLAVAIVLILFLLGMFGWKTQEGAPTFAIVLILGILTYVFGTTVGWWNDPSNFFGNWWNSDLTTMVIIILVFGLIIFFITGEESSSGFSDFAKEFLKRRK